MSTAQGERRLRLAATRSLLYTLPANELFELPGRPHVVYQLRTYSDTSNAEEAAQQARNDSPFLFKAFETGQIGPKRLARIHGDKPRVATIHEYLDWTVTAQAAEGDDELDFGGFRVLVILPRYRSGWPPPGGDVAAAGDTRKHCRIGAPKSPLPALQTHGKPVTAATIRSGPGYLEIPFVATHENKRGRGYCRCLVEAIEEIARALGLKKLMLCSTNDASVQSTWQHLGFEYASDEHMEEWDILHTDLVYLQNTTQMHKDVPPPRRLKPVVIKHDAFRHRCYAFTGQKRPQRLFGSAYGLAAPQTSKPRLSSRRSESTSRDESQSVAAREHPSKGGAVPNGDAMYCGAIQPLQLDVTPISAGLGNGTPQASTSAVGRPPSRPHPDHAVEQQRGGAGAARDEGVAGGGPPTPQPADGGHLRSLHVMDAPSTSQTALVPMPAGSQLRGRESAEQERMGGGCGELAMRRSHATRDGIGAATIVPEQIAMTPGFPVHGPSGNASQSGDMLIPCDSSVQALPQVAAQPAFPHSDLTQVGGVLQSGMASMVGSLQSVAETVVLEAPPQGQGDVLTGQQPGNSYPGSDVGTQQPRSFLASANVARTVTLQVSDATRAEPSMLRPDSAG